MTLVTLEAGDTPKSVWEGLDVLSKIQLRNRLDKLSSAQDGSQSLILEKVPYGHRIMIRVSGGFVDGDGAVEWGNQFLTAIREEKESEL